MGPVKWLKRMLGVRSPSEEFAGRCYHRNGWHLVLDDGQHDVLVRKCRDCDTPDVMSAANLHQVRTHRWSLHLRHLGQRHGTSSSGPLSVDPLACAPAQSGADRPVGK
jgi:hypothetical protein